MPKRKVSSQTEISSKYSKVFGVAILLIAGIITFFLIVGPTLIISYFIFMKPVQIRGEAMMPHYVPGQYYISQIMSKGGRISRGDVVVFESPQNPDIDLFKRVVGLPGERMMIRNGKVIINDIELDESRYLAPNIFTQTIEGGAIRAEEEITISPDHYIVMGDNRMWSGDSRVFGSIPRSRIKSKILFCYFGCNKRLPERMMRY